jgi:N-acetylglucosaminyldiphosphoundecaprenol N-acetyl-beta-D-mannosaminyltransferase
MAQKIPPAAVKTFSVLGRPIAKVTLDQALAAVQSLVEGPTKGNIVTFANVHMVVEAQKDAHLLRVMESAALNCPDGLPIASIGMYHFPKGVTQVSGPRFMPLFCEQNVDRGYRHFLLGGGPDVAEAAARNLQERYPGIQIVGTFCPPYDGMTPEQTKEMHHQINESEAQVIWVCLGCPKQEKWMYDHRDSLNAKVLLGIGQALDIIAGTKKRAPEVLTVVGLEWAYRLAREPQRLWRRYLTTNALFIYLTARNKILSLLRHS